MMISRPTYMEKLKSGMGSEQVKIITGIRRCGKSYLVFRLFKNYLVESGVPQENIIEMAFDRFSNRTYRDPNAFYTYASQRLSGDGPYYLLLDEVQLLGDFAEVLNDFIAMPNVDVYVTGSNARLLSKDVVTEFRGRGREIAMAPLSFSEFMGAYEGDRREGYIEYLTYGGLPEILSQNGPEEKADYLGRLYDELYVRDVVERNGLRNIGNLEDIIDVLASGIGSLVSPTKIAATFKSKKRTTVAPETIERYIAGLEDAFLIRRAKRFDVKGRRYIASPCKYYFTDLGLRNVRLNFRQLEETHLMENAIYNELVGRGYAVDVGMVPSIMEGADGKRHRKQLEVDFVCNKGSRRCYIQSALSMPTEQKAMQERTPLERIGDEFKKVVVTGDSLAPHYDNRGILIMNVYDFLLERDSLEF